MNFKKKCAVVLLSLFTVTTYPKVVEFVEDAYLKQAPQEIVNQVEKVADVMEFETIYEVAEPKKAGIQINPWNKFVAYGINPLTQNPFIIINTEWFSTIPSEQQVFLLGRAFATFAQGAVPGGKIITYLFILFRILLILLLFWVLGKTPLAKQNIWIRFLLALILNAAASFIFMNQFEASIQQHLASRHYFAIN